MARSPVTFRQRDVKAAVKAAVAAGVEVARVEIDTDGKIIVVMGKAAEEAASDFDKWKTAHGPDQA